MNKAEFLTRDLPDPISAQRFLDQFNEKHPSHASKLAKNDALLSDVLTLASFSPLLATTLLTNPDYLSWLSRERSQSGVRSKEDLLESLARFTLTNSQAETHVVLARFRRRELIRIFLSDIRRLTTIAEITEDISNLADAILENALRVAKQELDNRYGTPFETDDKGKARPAEFCVVSLGKLGSKELNYSSDIDLLFLYSNEGSTSGNGSRGSVTNREYFVKLAETITKLVGHHGGEGASYRVDLRLRPHGRVGPLAMSVKDTASYYLNEAGAWERQVLIRSRASAGRSTLFKQFFRTVEDAVFSKGETVENALRNVRLSKQKIDLEHKTDRGFDVKLGKGGIREIEFIAQALQIAYGGNDKWLRARHTLVSLSRLADRKLIGEHELTELFDAYDFLRHLEHILQMENGLQTHLVPNDPERRLLIAKRAGLNSGKDFEANLKRHTTAVRRIFERVFADVDHSENDEPVRTSIAAASLSSPVKAAASVFPKFAALADVPADQLPDEKTGLVTADFEPRMLDSISGETDFRSRLAALRETWHKLFNEIVYFDAGGRTALAEIKRAQTRLAEASISAGLQIARTELEKRYDAPVGDFRFAVLGLGKLGGAGIDYESDLDLILVYDESVPVAAIVTHGEFYSRAAEFFVTALSGMTRQGHLYRVDLRLRPYGKNGPSALSRTALAEYMQESAAIWEMLAYVKLRAVGGDPKLAEDVEKELRAIIHSRAQKIDPREIAAETRRIRMQLEKEKTGRRTGEVDIKFGSGGMLDIYFAIRYLQLRDNVPDDAGDRSTVFMLSTLKDRGSLAEEDFTAFDEGYKFLAELDHYLRLAKGRATRIPMADPGALAAISERMQYRSFDRLLETLTMHRLALRTAFDRVVR